jgi:hypothetical protein
MPCLLRIGVRKLLHGYKSALASRGDVTKEEAGPRDDVNEHP